MEREILSGGQKEKRPARNRESDTDRRIKEGNFAHSVNKAAEAETHSAVGKETA